KGVIPPGYWSHLVPRDLLDTQAEHFNEPKGQNLGKNEGRVHPRLRAAAQFANILTCSLPLSAISFANGDTKFGKAFADLSVTGRRAFEQFKKLPANYCQTIAARTIQFACHCVNPTVRGGCKTPAAPSAAAMISSCKTTLTRA